MGPVNERGNCTWIAPLHVLNTALNGWSFLEDIVLKLISPFFVSRRILARVELPDTNATSTAIGPLYDVRERWCLSPVDGGGVRSASGTFKSVSTTQVPLIDPFILCIEMKFEAGGKTPGDCLELEVASVYDGGED